VPASHLHVVLTNKVFTFLNVQTKLKSGMMNKLIFFTLLLLQQPTEMDTKTVQKINSDISQVTVYQNGALITRNATVELKNGRNVLVFTRLSRNIIERTIQIKGTGNYTLVSVNRTFDYLNEQQESRELKELREKAKELENAIKLLNTKLTVANKKIDFLVNNQNFSENAKYTSAELEAVFDAYSNKLEEVSTNILQMETEQSSKQAELQKIRRQINQLTSGRQQATGEIEVIVDAAENQSSTLSLSYLMNNAGWTPVYDLKVEGTKKPATLVYKAAIRQNSGFDWNNVQLTVSSASPNENTTLPELQPWFIDFYEPEQRTKARSEEVLNSVPSQVQEMEEGGDFFSVASPIATFQSQATSFSYTIDRAFTVPSDGQKYSAVISNNELPANYSYSAVPKLSSYAFLQAHVQNWDELNLLPGTANLFLDNSYVGTSFVNPNVTSDSLSFSLGTDKSIVISRKNVRDFESRNFFGSKVRETKAFQISVRNTKPTPITLQLRDQIPIAQDEDINIDLRELNGGSLNRQTGIITWKMDIDAGQTQTIDFSYEVEYPKGKQLSF